MGDELNLVTVPETVLNDRFFTDRVGTGGFELPPVAFDLLDAPWLPGPLPQVGGPRVLPAVLEDLGQRRMVTNLFEDTEVVGVFREIKARDAGGQARHRFALVQGVKREGCRVGVLIRSGRRIKTAEEPAIVPHGLNAKLGMQKRGIIPQHGRTVLGIHGHGPGQRPAPAFTIGCRRLERGRTGMKDRRAFSIYGRALPATTPGAIAFVVVRQGCEIRQNLQSPGLRLAAMPEEQAGQVTIEVTTRHFTPVHRSLHRLLHHLQGARPVTGKAVDMASLPPVGAALKRCRHDNPMVLGIEISPGRVVQQPPVVTVQLNGLFNEGIDLG